MNYAWAIRIVYAILIIYTRKMAQQLRVMRYLSRQPKVGFQCPEISHNYCDSSFREIQHLWLS